MSRVNSHDAVFYCGINIPLHNVLEMKVSWTHSLFLSTAFYIMKLHILQLKSDFMHRSSAFMTFYRTVDLYLSIQVPMYCVHLKMYFI